jgi:hypothetical protein
VVRVREVTSTCKGQSLAVPPSGRRDTARGRCRDHLALSLNESPDDAKSVTRVPCPPPGQATPGEGGDDPLPRSAPQKGAFPRRSPPVAVSASGGDDPLCLASTRSLGRPRRTGRLISPASPLSSAPVESFVPGWLPSTFRPSYPLHRWLCSRWGQAAASPESGRLPPCLATRFLTPRRLVAPRSPDLPDPVRSRPSTSCPARSRSASPGLPRPPGSPFPSRLSPAALVTDTARRNGTRLRNRRPVVTATREARLVTTTRSYLVTTKSRLVARVIATITLGSGGHRQSMI